jgi:Cu+-exporting ATPase
MFRDPVCGMQVDPGEAVASREHSGEVFYFCSEECVDEFDSDPHFYGHQSPYYEDSDDEMAHHHH